MVSDPNGKALGICEVPGLGELLQRITRSLKNLGGSSTVESPLLEDLDELPARTQELGKDLETKLGFCRDLCEKLGAVPGRVDSLEGLVEGNESVTESILRPLHETRKVAQETERILDGLFKMASLRRVLGQIRDESTRRRVGQSLAATSIHVERILSTRKELLQSLETLKEEGLSEDIELDDALPRGDSAEKEIAEESPSSAARGDPGETRDTGDTGEAADTGDTGAAAARTTPGAEAVPRVPEEETPEQTPRGKAATAKRKENAGRSENEGTNALSSRDFRRFRAALDRWAKRYPLAPRHLADEVRVVSVTPEHAVAVRIDALWAARRRQSVTLPCRGDAVDERPQASIWEVPCSPPKDYCSATESQRIPGGEEVTDCPECDGSGQSICPSCRGEGKLKSSGSPSQEGPRCACKSGHVMCDTCGGSAKVRRQHSCETRYTTTRLEETDYSGELPPDVIAASAPEPSVRRTLTALEARRVAAGLDKKCCEVASERVGAGFLEDVLQPFCSSPAEDPDSEPSRRLVRATLEFSTIPVLRLECGFKSPSHAKGAARFQVWLCGTDQKLHFSSRPKAWTRMTSAWIAGIFGLSVAVGYLLASLLAG